MKNSPGNKLLKRISPYLFSLFTLFLFERIYQYCNEPAAYLGNPVLVVYHLKGLVMDLELTFVLGLLGYLLGLIISLFSKKGQLLPFHLIALFAICGNFALTIYFLKAGQPLADVFFVLSNEEIAIAADLKSNLSLPIILLFIVLINLYFILPLLYRKIKSGKKASYALLILLVASAFIYPWKLLRTKSYTSDLVANNKLAVLIDAGERYYFKKEDHSTFDKKDLAALDRSFFNGNEPENQDYPFLHELPEESSLNKYINHTPNKPPNVVIIIVESLSSYMFGENAGASGHMMPFLDSLSEKSLYFPNFLSTCERTHNVLPAALTSVPNPPNGMQLQTDEYPRHWSMMSLLNRSYYSRFYCGVGLDYCNMKGYMNYHNTDYLVNSWEKRFSTTINGKDNPWGHPDSDLFQKSWLDLKKQKVKQPRLDVFLTLSTHEPFIIPKQDYYLSQVKKRFKKNRRFSKEQALALKKPEALATYIYTDDALKEFFATAKKQPGFDNTIYLIFGDHGNHDMLFSELDRFRTALLIYSPLLKKPQRFDATSTQLDITPSLINFMRVNYPELQLPKRVPFYGKEFTLKKDFECNVTLPLITIDQNNQYLVMDSYLFHEGALFQIKKGLKIKESSNAKQKAKMERQLGLFCRLSKYLYDFDRILPEEVFELYVESFNFLPIFTNKGTFKPGETQDEFIDIGRSLSIDTESKAIRVEFTEEVFLNNEKELSSLPLFTLDLGNFVGDKKDLLFWKQVKPVLIEKFKPNAWNKIRFSTVVRLKDYKRLLKNNTLGYYLLNAKKKNYRMRNFELNVFAGK